MSKGFSYHFPSFLYSNPLHFNSKLFITISKAILPFHIKNYEYIKGNKFCFLFIKIYFLTAFIAAIVPSLTAVET